MEVFSEEWSSACCARLNARGRYRELGRTWNHPVALVMRPAPALGVERSRAVYLDLAGGVCSEARPAGAADLERADFVLSAEVKEWKRLLGGDLDPITAVMFGKLKLEKGSMTSLLPHASVARELISAAREVGGTFPVRRSGAPTD